MATNAVTESQILATPETSEGKGRQRILIKSKLGTFLSKLKKFSKDTVIQGIPAPAPHLVLPVAQQQRWQCPGQVASQCSHGSECEHRHAKTASQGSRQCPKLPAPSRTTQGQWLVSNSHRGALAGGVPGGVVIPPGGAVTPPGGAVTPPRGTVTPPGGAVTLPGWGGEREGVCGPLLYSHPNKGSLTHKWRS